MNIAQAIIATVAPKSNELVIIGSTESILREMFPMADAHVLAWRRHKWLQSHEPFIKDRNARSQFLIGALLRDRRRHGHDGLFDRNCDQCIEDGRED